MSDTTPDGLEAARRFFDQLMDEPGNLKAVQSDLVRLAQDRGFDCTIDDLTTVLRELWGEQTMILRYSERPGF